MPNYERMYFQLSAKVVDAINILIDAQQQGEKEYIEGDQIVYKLTRDQTEKEEDN